MIYLVTSLSIEVFLLHKPHTLDNWLFVFSGSYLNGHVGLVSLWSARGLMLVVALPRQPAKAFLRRLSAEQGIKPDYETTINQSLMLIS